MDWAPKAPEGTDGPKEIGEWVRGGTVTGLLLLLGLGTLFFPNLVSTGIRIITRANTELLLDLSNRATQNAVFLITVTLLIAALHEAAHFLANLALGYKPKAPFLRRLLSLDRRGLDLYIIVEKQFVARQDQRLTLLAPILILNTPALVGLLFVEIPSDVTLLFQMVLILNTSLSGQDFVDFVYLRKFEPGTLFWTVETEEGIKSAHYTPN